MVKNKEINIVIAFLIGVIMFMPNGNVYYATNGQRKLDQVSLLSGFVPFLSLLILIGGSIIITLFYVSWRKYRGNKLREKIKKENSNH